MRIGRLAMTFGLLGWLVAGCVSGAPAGAPLATEPGTTRWTIGPTRVPCTGVAPMWCLQVRAVPDGPWTRFYGQIEGFEFRAGEEVDLLVRQVPVPNPPADAPNRRTVMVRELERRALAPGALPAALAGSAWRLASMRGADDVAGARGPVTMTFDATPRIAGSAGVNRYGAKVVAGDGWLRVSGAITTRMAGTPEAMRQESTFLGRLQQAALWRIDGDRLNLFDAQGVELMTLARAPVGSGG